MSLAWKIYSLIVDVGLLVVFLTFLAEYRGLGKRLMMAEVCIERLEQDKRTLYRKLNEVQEVKQGGVKSKPVEKARDELARNSDNSSDSGSSSSSSSSDSSSF